MNQLLKPFLITGDINSHSIKQESQKTDNNGKEV